MSGTVLGKRGRHQRVENRGVTCLDKGVTKIPLLFCGKWLRGSQAETMEKEKMCIALILMEKNGGSYIQRSGREGARPEDSWN